MRLGKYEVLLELASGGMGVVHVARQVGAAGFSRLVVVKRLHDHLAKEPEFHAMVRDEAALASKILHPNVVPVVDVVEQEGVLALVLDYVPSVSLSALVKAARARGRVLPPAVASRVVSDALAGLHAAHEARDLAGTPLGIVHRDVSPHNVIVGTDGIARLVDFGIAKAAVRLARTRTGDLKGKLAYMAPEQIHRKEVDRRTDVFAAGATLYEALTGEPLFDGVGEGAVLLGVLMGRPTELTARGFAPELDALLGRATEASPDDRFPDARAFREALERALPPASHDEVARVVAEHCGAGLEAHRRALVEIVARAPSGTEVGPFGALAGGSSPASARATSSSAPTRLERSPRRRLLVGLGAGAVVGAVALTASLGLVARARANAAPDAARAPSTAPAAPAGPAAESPPVASGSPAASVPSTGVSSAAPAAHEPPEAGVSPARPARTRPAPGGPSLRRNPYR